MARKEDTQVKRTRKAGKLSENYDVKEAGRSNAAYSTNARKVAGRKAAQVRGRAGKKKWPLWEPNKTEVGVKRLRDRDDEKEIQRVNGNAQPNEIFTPRKLAVSIHSITLGKREVRGGEHRRGGPVALAGRPNGRGR